MVHLSKIYVILNKFVSKRTNTIYIKGRSLMENTKKIDWYTLAFMAFSTVWGFGNVLNGFVYFNGVQVIFSWILMFALYFVPYA